MQIMLQYNRRLFGFVCKHLPSSCLDLTIVIAYGLDYRNQRLLLFSLFGTLLHVWYWICVLVIASQMVYVNCIDFQLSQGFSSSCVWWCISSTLATVRLTSVILCNSLLTMLVVQVFVLLQPHGTFYQDCALSLGNAPSRSVAGLLNQKMNTDINKSSISIIHFLISNIPMFWLVRHQSDK